MTDRPARSRSVTALVAVGLLAACSGAGRGESGPSDSPTGPPSAAANSPSRSATSAPASPVTSTPLVLATHPTRDALDVSSALARRVLAGNVTNWRELGASPGPLRVVAAPRVTVGPDVRVTSAARAVVSATRDARVLAVLPATVVGPRVRVARVDGVHPLRRPTSYSLRTPGPRPGRVTTATVTGDLMLARRVGARMASVGDFAAALRPTARRLAAADLTVGNLESTLARTGAPRQGGDSFGADPRVRRGLRLAGFDLLSLANNHVGDYGPDSLVRTVRRVRAAGMVPVGAGPNLRTALAPAVVERGGLRFGVLAFDAIGETPAAGPGQPGALRVRMRPRTGPLVRADLDRVLDAVRRLRPDVDVLMVLPHWGTQYTTGTVQDQRQVGRALLRAGADLVVGGHPHWVQGVEARGDGLIAYSLGNYVFDMEPQETREGALLELTYWGDTLMAAELVPVRIGPDFAPRVVGGAAARVVLDRVRRASGPPLGGSHG